LLLQATTAAAAAAAASVAEAGGRGQRGGGDGGGADLVRARARGAVARVSMRGFGQCVSVKEDN